MFRKIRYLITKKCDCCRKIRNRTHALNDMTYFICDDCLIKYNQKYLDNQAVVYICLACYRHIPTSIDLPKNRFLVCQDCIQQYQIESK